MARLLHIFNDFVRDYSNYVHDLRSGSTHELRFVLYNGVLTRETQAKVTAGFIVDLATANGYTQGGKTIGTVTNTQISRTRMIGGSTPVVWTAAAGGDIGPWQYAILYNNTATSPENAAIGFFDFGPNRYIRRGKTFTIEVSQLFRLRN